MTARFVKLSTEYPQCAELSYTIYCTCSYCRAQTFMTLGRSAYTDDEFVRMARGYKLSKEQQQRIDEIELRLWEGERAG